MKINYKPIDIINQLNNIDLTTIKLPDYSDIPNVRVKGVELIHSDLIYSDDSKNNSARFYGTDPKNIENLRRDFQFHGFKPTEVPGAVIYRGDNFELPYERLNGFTRDAMYHEKGIKETPQVILEFFGTEDQIKLAKRRVACRDNSSMNSSPRKTLSENDLVKNVIESVKQKLIPNTQKDIEDEIKLIDPIRKPGSINKIAHEVFNNCDTKSFFTLWGRGSNKASVWKKHNVNTDETFMFGGEIDPKRNQRGILVGDNDDYIQRAISKAIRNYNEDGIHTYIIGHVGSPTSRTTISEKRINFKNKFEETCNTLKEYVKLETKVDIKPPIYILGFLPQQDGVDNWSELVKL